MPTEAPPAPPTAAPSAPPAPDFTSNAFKDIESAFEKSGDVVKDPPAAPPAKPADAPPPAAPAAKKPDEPPPAAPAKPADKQPAAPPAPAKPPEPAKEGPKELRAEKDRLKGELATATKERDDLKAKVADYEKKRKDSEAVMARLAERDKEVERLQGELRAAKKDTSQEFKQKYDQPFADAADYAKAVVEGMKNAEGQPFEWERDFKPVYYGQKSAVEVFGEDNAAEVMNHVRELKRLDFVKQRALKAEMAEWETKQKEEDGRRVQQRADFEKAFTAASEELQQKDPLYNIAVDDNEALDLRKKTLAILDAPAKSANEEVAKNLRNRQMVGMFFPHRLIISRQEKRIKELEAEVEKLRPKQPGADNEHPTREGGAAPELDWEAGARKAMEGVS